MASRQSRSLHQASLSRTVVCNECGLRHQGRSTCRDHNGARTTAVPILGGVRLHVCGATSQEHLLAQAGTVTSYGAQPVHSLSGAHRAQSVLCSMVAYGGVEDDTRCNGNVANRRARHTVWLPHLDDSDLGPSSVCAAQAEPPERCASCPSPWRKHQSKICIKHI